MEASRNLSLLSVEFDVNQAPANMAPVVCGLYSDGISTSKIIFDIRDADRSNERAQWLGTDRSGKLIYYPDERENSHQADDERTGVGWKITIVASHASATSFCLRRQAAFDGTRKLSGELFYSEVIRYICIAAHAAIVRFAYR